MMSDGKKKFQYDLVIAQTAQISLLYAGEFNPYNANPYRMEEVENLKTEQDKELESEAGFKALGVFLEKLAKNHKKKK